MANKRMFSLYVIDSDAFLDMPLTTQALYFHLCMRADDDGFINNQKKIQRMVSATDDDMKLLIAKQFLIPFETGVLVIRHWKIHNAIRKDMYKPTMCLAEKAFVDTDDTGVYQVRNEPVTDTVRGCIEGVTDLAHDRDGNVTLDKIRLDKDRLDNNKQSEIAHDSVRDQFEHLWSIYPNKKGKKRAFESFRRALKNGVTIDQIRDGIEAYVRYIKASGIDMRYVKQGSTFFAQECWNDDWTPEKPKNAFNQFEHNEYDFDELEKDLGIE